MNSTELNQVTSQDVSAESADPYQTPAEVPGTKGRGWMRSPLVWVFMAGLLAAGIMTVALGLRPVSTHVEDFGITRAGPPIEEIEEYAPDVETP